MWNFTVNGGQLTLSLAAPPAWLDRLVVELPGGQRLAHDFVTPPSPAPCLPAPDLVEQFLVYLDLREDLGRYALRDYRQRLGQFVAWLAGRPLGADLWLAYYGHLKRRQPPYSPFTLKGHFHILNRFGRWLAEQGHLPESPLAGVQTPGLPKNLEPRAIAAEHVERMLERTRTDRDRALLLFFRDTGCRADEALQLTWGRLKLKARKTEVVGKGDKGRRLFFKPLTRLALETYRAGLPAPRQAPGAPLWWGKRGPLSYDGLYKIFKRLARSAGVDDGVANPHSWRHAFGRDTTIKGIPTAQLQDLMGHSSMETTKVYAVFNTMELQQAHDRYSPVDGDLGDLTQGEDVVKYESK